MEGSVVSAAFTTLLLRSKPAIMTMDHQVQYTRTWLQWFSLWWILSSEVHGFLAAPSSIHPSSTLDALTERQLQFWEDVDTGLTDIENFYAKKGQDIDRIRIFAKTYVILVA